MITCLGSDECKLLDSKFASVSRKSGAAGVTAATCEIQIPMAHRIPTLSFHRGLLRNSPTEDVRLPLNIPNGSFH